MSRFVRPLLIVIGIIEVVLSIGFIFQIPLAIGFFPFPSVSPLSYLLLGSAFATAATLNLWPPLKSEDDGIIVTGLVHFIMPPALGIYALMYGQAGKVVVFTLAMALATVIGLALTVYGWRVADANKQPLTPVVRWSFVLFLVALALSGPAMLLQKRVLPWPLTPELSFTFGVFFITAGLGFVYSLLRPNLANAMPLLASFLAYDIVLIGPFLQQLPTIRPEFRISMIVYLIALVYSGGLAIYMLFVNPKTRIVGKAAVKETNEANKIEAAVS